MYSFKYKISILLITSLVLLAIGISHAYEQGMITRFLVTMGELGLALTILVALLTWLFIQGAIIDPLQNVMLGTREVVAGHLAEKDSSLGTKEIEEMKDTLDQLVEQIQALTGEINRLTKTNIENAPTEITELSDLDIDNTVAAEPKPLPGLATPWRSGEQGLPKGLNKATLGQIVQFLQVTRGPISVEEVAEGVKMTRVTVRRYLEFLEQRGVLRSEQKYGTVGRPVKLFIPM